MKKILRYLIMLIFISVFSSSFGQTGFNFVPYPNWYISDWAWSYIGHEFINPESSESYVSQTGAVDHPWSSWTYVTFGQSTEYSQLRGTSESFTGRTAITLSHQSGDLHHIKLGVYGPGTTRARIISDGNHNGIYLKYTNHIVIDSLELIGHISENYAYSMNGIALSEHTSGNGTIPNTDSTFVSNCIIRNFGTGIDGQDFEPPNFPDATEIRYLTVYNTSIYHIGEDGIIGPFDHFTADKCHIYDVNRHWFTGLNHSQNTAGGDCIQIRGDDYLIQNNILDRRGTGNKFCFIYGANAPFYPHSGTIRYNVFYPPMDTICDNDANPDCQDQDNQLDDDGGGCIYISISDRVDIYGNIFIGTKYQIPYEVPSGGMHNQADTINFFYNLCDSVSGWVCTNDGSIENKELNFFNNTFVGAIQQLTAGGSYVTGNIWAYDSITYRNNIHAGASGTQPLINGIYVITQSNNIENNNSATWDVNPGFVDWENNNYHIATGGTAIDAGYTYSTWNYDLDSLTVPVDTRDIGCYEYQSSLGINPPTGSVNAVFTNITKTSFLATWTSIYDATGYYLLFGRLNDMPYTEVDLGNVLTFSSDTLTAGYSYYFGINPYNGAGDGPGVGKSFTTICDIPIIGDFSGTSTSIEAGEYVDYTILIDEPVCDSVYYHWLFEGGTPETNDSIAANAIYYTYPGTYDVTLFACTDGGCDTLIKTNYITVGAVTNTSVANFTGPRTLPINVNGHFYDQSTNNPTSWVWTFYGAHAHVVTDGTVTNDTIAYVQNPIVQYDALGEFDIKLRVENAAGADSVLMSTLPWSNGYGVRVQRVKGRLIILPN